MPVVRRFQGIWISVADDLQFITQEGEFGLSFNQNDVKIYQNRWQNLQDEIDMLTKTFIREN